MDDVLQETFLRAFDSLERFDWRGEDSLYSWLHGIARNVAFKLRLLENRDDFTTTTTLDR